MKYITTVLMSVLLLTGCGEDEGTEKQKAEIPEWAVEAEGEVQSDNEAESEQPDPPPWKLPDDSSTNAPPSDTIAVENIIDTQRLKKLPWYEYEVIIENAEEKPEFEQYRYTVLHGGETVAENLSPSEFSDQEDGIKQALENKYRSLLKIEEQRKAEQARLEAEKPEIYTFEDTAKLEKNPLARAVLELFLLFGVDQVSLHMREREIEGVNISYYDVMVDGIKVASNVRGEKFSPDGEWAQRLALKLGAKPPEKPSERYLKAFANHVRYHDLEVSRKDKKVTILEKERQLRIEIPLSKVDNLPEHLKEYTKEKLKNIRFRELDKKYASAERIGLKMAWKRQQGVSVPIYTVVVDGETVASNVSRDELKDQPPSLRKAVLRQLKILESPPPPVFD